MGTKGGFPEGISLNAGGDKWGPAEEMEQVCLSDQNRGIRSGIQSMGRKSGVSYK